MGTWGTEGRPAGAEVAGGGGGGGAAATGSVTKEGETLAAAEETEERMDISLKTCKTSADEDLSFLKGPPFRSVKRGVPPSTFPPSGTRSSWMTPAAGEGT